MWMILKTQNINNQILIKMKIMQSEFLGARFFSSSPFHIHREAKQRVTVRDASEHIVHVSEGWIC